MKYLQAVSLVLLAALFVTTGTLHFMHAQFFEGIVPPWLPAHQALVAISGAAEIAGGIGLLAPQTRRYAGTGLIVLLVAVFPANIHMALHPDIYVATASRSALLWRLPLQAVAIAWVWFAALR